MGTVSSEKVYCENCGNVRSLSGAFGDVNVYCKLRIQKSQKDSPVKIVRKFFTLEEMNSNNDCLYYRKKGLIESLWANTHG